MHFKFRNSYKKGVFQKACKKKAEMQKKRMQQKDVKKGIRGVLFSLDNIT